MKATGIEVLLSSSAGSQFEPILPVIVGAVEKVLHQGVRIPGFRILGFRSSPCI